MRISINRTVMIVVAAALFIGGWSVMHAQQAAPTVVRTVLLEQDLSVPGYKATLVEVRIPVGGREGKHTHAGTALIHVEEGELTLEHEGKPTKTYKVGESFVVEPGKVHEGINKGNVPIKAIATFIGEKGKPLTTQVPAATK